MSRYISILFLLILSYITQLAVFMIRNFLWKHLLTTPCRQCWMQCACCSIASGGVQAANGTASGTPEPGDRAGHHDIQLAFSRDSRLHRQRIQSHRQPTAPRRPVLLLLSFFCFSFRIIKLIVESNFNGIGIKNWPDIVSDMSDRANDLRQFRIDLVLQEMQDMKLCQLPDDEAWPVEYFTEQTQVQY